ncbi:hypothetical protein J23TS9_01720 [Paenibacillus sp. J23TS9]|uniref:hypothetical protein n=1 Tax=Paenibacillus sp. J23TS9 TaxID=2807193 RepID=UPI001B2B724A|nr:hypothetical protein [Paenibacillus sp. J23TS9]GIP25042.1 hypothetical protein J23TS9_01720 [Paenibacillus sp. J23TS9]
MKTKFIQISCYSHLDCNGDCSYHITALEIFIKLTGGQIEPGSLVQDFEMFFEDGKPHTFISIDEQTYLDYVNTLRHS